MALKTREIRELIGPADGDRALRVEALMLEPDFVSRSLGSARAAYDDLGGRARSLRAALGA
ncbi:KAP NTPase domain-containing protein OS=Streptomyces fumanus OX=67302 GN=GCM10018772_42580 PE=4 SV=1 [Streptomyces fumanus]